MNSPRQNHTSVGTDSVPETSTERIRHDWLRSEIVADRAADSVRLLVGLAAGFWACTPVDTIRRVLEGLGRADARLVLEELSEKHSYSAKFVRGMHPELVRVLEDKCS